jgi:tetratricopeptide (TPR) repeat protein
MTTQASSQTGSQPDSPLGLLAESALNSQTGSTPGTQPGSQLGSEQNARPDSPKAPQQGSRQSSRQDSQQGLTGRLSEVALGYQRMLAENPCHPKALVGMSLVALASRQSEAAVKMARAALARRPQMGTAWVALGQALKAAGRNEEAERAYLQAISLDGMNALARMGLGELMLATGRPEAAIKEFELALRKQPALAAAHMGLGNALAMMGRYEEALSRYEQALKLRPRLPEAEFAAGFALARMGRLKEAETALPARAGLRPDFAAAWMNLGSLLREQGREVYAEAALLRAVELRPDLISGWVNLAILERERHRPAEAEATCARPSRSIRSRWRRWWPGASSAPPSRTWPAPGGGCAGPWPAIRSHAEAVNMHGILLHNERPLRGGDRGLRAGRGAGPPRRRLQPRKFAAGSGPHGRGLAGAGAAVERDPASGSGAQYNLALTRLRLGDWEQGWPGYEARWRFREVHRSPWGFRQPRWQGEALEGRRILLHAEQGLGDTIQFCRYAALVAARGGAVILQVQEPVERLMARWPWCAPGRRRLRCWARSRRSSIWNAR